MNPYQEFMSKTSLICIGPLSKINVFVPEDKPNTSYKSLMVDVLGSEPVKIKLPVNYNTSHLNVGEVYKVKCFVDKGSLKCADVGVSAKTA